MSSSNPTHVLIATSLGLCLSTSFTIGSLGLTYFAIPAILLPSDAPLMPPLELVTERQKRHFQTEKAPKQPFDSGIGDEKETLLDSGATSKVLRHDGKGNGSPSSSSYLLRQWFHLFSKGMHTMPPFTMGSALLYMICAFTLPGPLIPADSWNRILAKRACYIISALLSAGVMVFTLTALKPVNSALHERVKDVVKQEQGDGTAAVGIEGHTDDKRHETEALIRKWGKMNAIRAILPVLAVVSAITALVL
ncbi:hypothetical protein H2198_006183 [Neophaeococcomyces mojaviensis]|uniref:Uncharacterized protein n=1 Tax=Neophaeococcomyces mojaviensis TaxID=3383035 RepID=A0ACC3A3S6_9EURO|nr:hypothetical protein H2198_006183 [Knufia sp. JES_112]